MRWQTSVQRLTTTDTAGSECLASEMQWITHKKNIDTQTQTWKRPWKTWVKETCRITPQKNAEIQSPETQTMQCEGWHWFVPDHQFQRHLLLQQTWRDTATQSEQTSMSTNLRFQKLKPGIKSECSNPPIQMSSIQISLFRVQRPSARDWETSLIKKLQKQTHDHRAGITSAPAQPEQMNSSYLRCKKPWMRHLSMQKNFKAAPTHAKKHQSIYLSIYLSIYPSF